MRRLFAHLQSGPSLYMPHGRQRLAPIAEHDLWRKDTPFRVRLSLKRPMGASDFTALSLIQNRRFAGGPHLDRSPSSPTADTAATSPPFQTFGPPLRLAWLGGRLGHAHGSLELVKAPRSKNGAGRSHWTAVRN